METEGRSCDQRGWFEKVLRFLSAEFLLERRANSGALVLQRAMLAAILPSILVVLATHAIDPDATWTWCGFRKRLLDTLPWLGTMFGAFYAALYSRFASQWGYASGLYNEIKCAECNPETKEEALAQWKAAFVEDCDDLHLDRKPSFAAVIRLWADDARVKAAFESSAPRGPERLAAIKIDVEKVCKENCCGSE
jgi:hypothetical protein